MASAAEAKRLYDEGRLDDAVGTLNAAVRDDPANVSLRMFLFELLCFSGDWKRARAQLDAVAAVDPELLIAAGSYRQALAAQNERAEMFRLERFPESPAPAGLAGSLNGTAFKDLRAGDPRLGARIEAIASGRYVWLPFEHIVRLSMEPPLRLRDLYWIPTEIEATLVLGGEVTEVLLPALSPLAHEDEDDEIRLGRATDWYELEGGGEAPVGLSMLLVDGEEIPLLEVREIIIEHPGE